MVKLTHGVLKCGHFSSTVLTSQLLIKALTCRFYSYFSSSSDSKGPSPLETKLDALFDSLRGRNSISSVVSCGQLTLLDDGNDSKDKLDLDSTMGYLSSKLKVSLENSELFVVMELVQAPNVGEITRKGYVEGWKKAG